MRDIKRLDGFYEKLKEIHAKSFPDWRFFQFMFNFICEYGDPFFLEEDMAINELKKYANKNSSYFHWDIEEHN